MMAYNNGKTSLEKIMSRVGIEPVTLRLHVRLRYHYAVEISLYIYIICVSSMWSGVHMVVLNM